MLDGERSEPLVYSSTRHSAIFIFVYDIRLKKSFDFAIIFAYIAIGVNTYVKEY